MSILLRVVSLEGVSQSKDRVDGLWLQSFDVEAFNGGGDAVFTTDRAKALRFADIGAAFEAWKTQSKTKPLRPDGRPNRPLTAFSVTFEDGEV